MVTMKHHHARGPEETVYDLPLLVPAERASRDRQHACGKPECQTTRRQKTSWRCRNPGSAITWRIDQRAAQTQPPPEPMRLPEPLNQLPWEFAKDQFGSQRADFIGVMGALMVRSAKDQFLRYPVDFTRLSGTLPHSPRKTSPGERTSPLSGESVVPSEACSGKT
jgi:hypothetical protein